MSRSKSRFESCQLTELQTKLDWQASALCCSIDLVYCPLQKLEESSLLSAVHG